MSEPRILAVEPPAPEGPSTRRSPRRIVIVSALVLAVGVIAVTTLLPRWLTTPDDDGQAVDAPVAAIDGRRIQATLFYLAESGTALVETSRSVLYGETESLQVRRIVEAQIAAPPDGLVNPVPDGTRLRAAFVTDAREAYVDLSGAIVSGHTGGSLDEALTVYAIVNAITVNLPEVTAVQILIDGQEVDSLAGHIDLRAPLAKSLDWVEGHERTATSDDTN